MPEDKNKTPKAPKRYTNAVKVEKAPSQKEGWSKGETIGTNTYYDKEAKKAIVGGSTNVNAGVDWENAIKKMLAEGVSPEELVAKGHISQSQIETFRPFYKAVYTNEPVKEPTPAVNAPVVGTRIGATALGKATANQPWEDYEIGDPNGQANVKRKVMVDPISGKLVDQAKYLQTGDITKSLTDETLDQARQGALRSDAQLPSMQPNFDANGNPITNKIKVPTIVNPPAKQGTLNSGTSGGFKGGGKIKAPCMNKGGKVKGYADGSWVTADGMPISEQEMGYSDADKLALGYKQSGTSQGGIDKSQIGNSALALGTGVLSGLAAKQGQQKGDYQTIDTTDPLVAGTATAGLNAVIPGAGTAVGAGLKAKDMAVGQLSQIDDTTGKYKNKNQAYGAGLIDAAYKATPLGMAQTALDKDKTLGEKALSIGTLGIADIVKSKKNIDEMETANSGKALTEQNRIKSEAAISEAMRKRNAGEFAGGGLIKGKGGPKDDAIDAKVKAGSFVVPAENVDKAKEIKKLIMKHAPSLKKANLNQKGGTQVKLSNGEMLISPKEVEKIEDKLGEKVWDKLAPNAAKAEDLSEGEMEEMELAHGGLTPEKARIMLHDGTVNGKKITDKQRRYFGWVSNGKKDGGEVKRYRTGGKVDATGKPVRDASTNETPQEFTSRLKVWDKNKTVTETKKVTPQGTTTTTKVKTAPKTGKTKFEPRISADEETIVPGQTVDTKYLGDPTKAEGSMKGVYNLPDNTLGTTGATDTPVNTSNGIKSFSGAGSGLGLSNAINYGVPAMQVGMGLKGLNEAGKRPVDKIDTAYNESVNRAINDSKYGMSPEEKFALKQRDQGLLNQGTFAARNYSGGNAASALANTRSAINDSYGRGLETTIRDKALQQQKKQYADQLVADRQEKSRRLFGDTMNAWKENQEANSLLVGAGIQNLVGASRYSAEQAAQKKINETRNSYLNSF